MLDGLAQVREVSIGAGFLLLVVLGLILRGQLFPKESYQRLVETIAEKDRQIAALTLSYQKIADALERLSNRRSNNRGRE